MAGEKIKFFIGVGVNISLIDGCVDAGTPTIAPYRQESTENGTMRTATTTDGGRMTLTVTCNNNTDLCNLLLLYSTNREGVPDGTNFRIVCPKVTSDANDNTTIPPSIINISGSLNHVEVTRWPSISLDESLKNRATIEFELRGFSRNAESMTR